MPSAFDTLVGDRFGVMADRFGTDAIYTPKGGVSKVIRAVFSRSRSVIGEGGAEYIEEVPTAECLASNFDDLRKGDTLQIDGVTYTIQAYPEDASGLLGLELSL